MKGKSKYPKIANVNKGVCHRRAQEGAPSFFVNYELDGVNTYEFFAMAFAMYTRYERLIVAQFL